MSNSDYEDFEEAVEMVKQLTLRNSSSIDEEKFMKVFSVLIHSCTVKELNRPEDIPYTEKEFDNLPIAVFPRLQCIHRILEELVIIESFWKFKPENIKSIFTDSVITLSQFQNQESYWSDTNCSSICMDILSCILKLSKCSSISQVLNGKSESDCFDSIFPKGILQICLRKIADDFTKKTWKNKPLYIDSYNWLLFNVKFPFLSEYLPYFLPPALFMLDDWEQHHKIIGVKALHHILQNTPSSELRWHGRAEVIYDSLKTNLYSREHELLVYVYPAVVMAANVVDKDPRNDAIVKKTCLDFILNHLLREMAHEEKLRLRSVYTVALKTLLEVMGIFAVRWSKEILKVSSSYLESYEGELSLDRLNILEALQEYIKNCWPRVHAYAEKIMKMVLHLVFQLSLDNPRVINKDELLQECKKTIELLYEAAPETVRILCRGLKTIDIPCRHNIQLVLQAVI